LNMHVKRSVWLIILFVVIILALVIGFMPKPVIVETAEVKRGPMRVTIDEEGKTRVMNRYVISAPVAGFALRIDLDVGDAVKKGQAITELEPLRSTVLDPRSRAEAKARVAAADAALHVANKNVDAAAASAEFARKELERIRRLFNEGFVTQDKLDEAETEERRTEAALRSSEFAVEVSRYDREAALTALKYSAATNVQKYAEKVAIKAPVSGHVLKITHESEGVVNQGQALIEIGNPQALEVEVDVLSADAVRIKPGTPVLFERWGGAYPLKGKVRVIEPAGFTKISALGVEEQRVLVISDIVSPPEEWERLGDGYRVEASFVLWEDDNVLQVPGSTLFRYNSDWAVFSLENKKARLSPVQIGYRNGMSAEIVSGLAEGDFVITHPDSSLEDGARVRFHEKKD
jgi:HlyD family secretion protein